MMKPDINRMVVKAENGERGYSVEPVEGGVRLTTCKDGIVLNEGNIIELYEYCGEIMDIYWRDKIDPIQAMIEKNSNPGMKVH